MNRRFAALLLPAALVGCAEVGAVEAELLVPADLALHWDRSFNGEGDDRVALVPVDLMVFGALSGEPVAGAPLVVEPGYAAVEVLRADQVVPVDGEACEVCVWDAWRDRYVELVGDEPVTGFGTDDEGVARAWLLVDAFPEAPEGGFEAVPVVVGSAVGEATFHLVPQ